MTAPVPIRFVAGSRQLAAVPRRLQTVSLSLEDLLAGAPLAFPPLAEGSDGYRVLSARADDAPERAPHLQGFIPGGYQRYRRHYIAMDGTFDDYLARFSGKTRSTLRRKRRKLERASGGALDLREYRSRAELQTFFDLALPLSRRTYQARLLDAGLPESGAEREAMLAAADRDAVRAYLLFLDGKPIAYLYLPVEGATLVYAWLGYDPNHARLSPGTVLQLAALERLFGEERVCWFDFTEGEGAHKAMFGTDSVECCRYLLLRPTLANRALLGSLAAFDGGVAAAKSVAEKTGALATARKLLRA